jgi:hypothetical protein
MISGHYGPDKAVGILAPPRLPRTNIVFPSEYQSQGVRDAERKRRRAWDRALTHALCSDEQIDERIREDRLTPAARWSRIVAISVGGLVCAVGAVVGLIDLFWHQNNSVLANLSIPLVVGVIWSCAAIDWHRPRVPSNADRAARRRLFPEYRPLPPRSLEVLQSLCDEDERLRRLVGRWFHDADDDAVLRVCDLQVLERLLTAERAETEARSQERDEDRHEAWVEDLVDAHVEAMRSQGVIDLAAVRRAQERPDTTSPNAPR